VSDQFPPDPTTAFPAPPPAAAWTPPGGAPGPGPYGLPGAAVPQPSLAPADRLRAAVARRLTADYLFSFWTALGWTLLTCGIFAFFVFYKMFERSVQHNQRRIEVLDAATTLAWERAVAAGRGDELTPWFQSLGAQIDVLRRVAGEFRDPTLWTVIYFVSGGIGQIVGYVFLDGDLTDHEVAERSAEDQLAAILASLGTPAAIPPAPAPKGRHNVVNRIIALFASCGLYGLWWQYDLMEEGNANYRADWAREDALLTALGA
jgi:hypothetical protein